MSDHKVINFGCRLNAYESQKINQMIAPLDGVSTLVVNSCAVTAEAERQMRQSLRKLRRDHPDHRLVLTGCAAQISPQKYIESKLADQVLGNQEKFNLQHYQPDQAGHYHHQVGDIMAQTEFLPEQTHTTVDYNQDKRVRAFIQIQDGCDHRCTFCIIPQGRGNSRSLSPEHIIHHIKNIVEQGAREVILTGVDLTSYQHKDIKLGSLVLQILQQIPELPRLRLSSIDCIEMDLDLFKAFKEYARLMPHVHLSLQAGHDMILKRMKRRHSRAQAVELCQELISIRPDIRLGADIIAGFPTETDEMFDHSLKLVDDCQLSLLHVFPFSARTGTPAALIPKQIPLAIRKERAKALRDKGQQAAELHLRSLYGKSMDVLVEKPFFGYNTDYTPVQFENKQSIGDIVKILALNSEKGKIIPSQMIDHPLARA